MSNSPIEDGEIRDIIDKTGQYSLNNSSNQDNYESVNMEMDSDTESSIVRNNRNNRRDNSDDADQLRQHLLKQVNRKMMYKEPNKEVKSKNRRSVPNGLNSSNENCVEANEKRPQSKELFEIGDFDTNRARSMASEYLKELDLLQKSYQTAKTKYDGLAKRRKRLLESLEENDSIMAKSDGCQPFTP